MKIVIVGGGTAGWIASYFIANAQPNKHEITVVESSKIGIIGAGEGSTGSLISLLSGDFFEEKIDLEEFLIKTDGTPKLGIKHIGWGKHKDSYFAPLDASPTGFSLHDTFFKYVFSKTGKEGMHLASSIGTRYSLRKTEPYPAVHFDGHKVGMFFKEKCEKIGVSVIDAVVSSINVVENKIKSIELDNKEVIYADMFIDCTGFSRLLMKALDVSWVSKQDVLPMNTAMPFILNYESGDEILPETTALALSSGWMWHIPLSTRRGCGYVFDRHFISKEEAKKEVEKLLGREITPIKYIEFDAGYSSYFLKENVLCLGLSSAFVEPLEATSIHNTIVQTAIFVNECLTDTPETTFTKENENTYNKRITFLNELTVDFISLHYQGGRDDTPFWKHIKENRIGTEWALSYVERAKTKIPGYSSFEGMYGSFSVPLANWILAGLDLITKEQAKKELELFVDESFIKKQHEEFYESFLYS